MRFMVNQINEPLSAINKPSSLRGEVYSRIKNAIVTNKFVPGERLDEKMLSESLGVSRTPVREALTRLQHEGLVQSLANRGVFVRKLAAEDVLEILQMREVTEGLAARLFTEKASDENVAALKRVFEQFTTENIDERIEEYNEANVTFHDMIIQGAQNSRLIAALDNLYDHYAMARTLRIIPVTRRGKRSLEEHCKILDAIENRDSDTAERLMREHIRLLAKDVIDHLSEL